jgi:hypothetical protein
MNIDYGGLGVFEPKLELGLEGAEAVLKIVDFWYL